MDKYVTPVLLGQNPMHIGQVMAKVSAVIARLTCIKEGVDLALHDLVGKTLGVSAQVLIGGSYRDKIAVASEIGIDTPEKMLTSALSLVEQGFKVIKIKGSADVDLDVVRIKAVREAVGDSIALRLDPNASWTTTATIKAMRELECCNLEVLEQPIHGLDLKGMAHIRNNIGVPLMADEAIWTQEDVLKIVDYGAADLINIKIAKSCGLHIGHQIETIAAANRLPCIVGTELEPGISMIAKLHFAASMQTHPYASDFTELSQLKDNVLQLDVQIIDGYVSVPQGPGFGVELNEDVLDKYRLA